MGKLKDLFIVSEKEKEDDIVVNKIEECVPEVNYTPPVVTGDTEEGLIDEVYTAANLSDKRYSIFKVEELRANLPDTLPTDTKRESVKGILSSFQLSLDDVLSDAFARVEALQNEDSKETEYYDNKISNNSALIEEYKCKIADLQAEVSELQVQKNNMKYTISKEIQHIEDLTSFINPTGGEK